MVAFFSTTREGYAPAGPAAPAIIDRLGEIARAAAPAAFLLIAAAASGAVILQDPAAQPACALDRCG